MPLMQWDESMSVGVEELDDQHRILISLINKAYEAIQKNDERITAQVIEAMHAYSVEHFRIEEGYLLRYEYPDLLDHKIRHAKFLETVLKFQKRHFERTNLSQVFVYLSRWLTHHIMDEDMKYVRYIPNDIVKKV